ncbi:MAG: hypothetical protein ACO2PL_16620 [Armatimonadota bacterium]
MNGEWRLVTGETAADGERKWVRQHFSGGRMAVSEHSSLPLYMATLLC